MASSASVSILKFHMLSKSDDHLARNTYPGTHLLQAAGKVPNSGDWRRHIKGKPHQAKVALARTAANTSTQAGSAAFVLAKMKELPIPVGRESWPGRHPLLAQMSSV